MISFNMKSENRLNDWIKSVNNEKLPGVVKKHALNISASAAKNAPVDTGLLKNTLADGAKPKDPHKWTISDATEYGVFQELGTSKGVTAKHFLGGAAEREAEPFFEDVRKALG